MLAIRLQRVGRQGYATYRLAVQEAQRHPSSGRVVAYVGSYNPHTKDANVQVELAQKYLDNGAQPTPRVVKLLSDAGIKLPKWVVKYETKTKSTRNAEKLRKNQPKVEEPEVIEEVAEETMAEEPVEVETTADDTTPEVDDAPALDAPTEEIVPEVTTEKAE
jgi:small subunit ribosomal protein S16